MLCVVACSVPDVLESGYCLAGGMKTTLLECVNTGGEGTFSVYKPDNTPNQQQDTVSLIPYALSLLDLFSHRQLPSLSWVHSLYLQLSSICLLMTGSSPSPSRLPLTMEWGSTLSNSIYPVTMEQLWSLLSEVSNTITFQCHH